MNKIKAVSIYMLLAFSLIAGPVQAAETIDMSLDTALMFALSNNPDIHITKDRENQSEAATREAKSAFYPQVNASASAGYEYNDPANFRAGRIGDGGQANASNQVSLNVNQMLFDGAQTKEEVARRRQLMTSSQFQGNVISEKIMTDTARSYMNVYRYQKILTEADQFITRLEAITGKINQMVEAGAENKAKGKYAQSRLAFAKSERSNAEASLANAVTELEFLTGKLPYFKASLPEMKDLLALGLDDYVALAEKNNHNLLLNDSDKKALAHELEKTKGQYLPTLGLLMNVTEANDVGGKVGSDRGAAAMLQVNYKIFDGHARKATKDRVQSQISEANHQTQRLQRDIRQQLKLAYNQIQSLEKEYGMVKEEEKTNSELQALYRDQFEFGEGDIINLIEGEENLYASQIRQKSIEADIVINSMQLVRQIGSLKLKEVCPS